MKTAHLKCDANVLPVLIGYFMNFGIRVHEDGYLKWKEIQSTKDKKCRKPRLFSNSVIFVWRQNVHTALQLFAIRLAVFLKVFSR